MNKYTQFRLLFNPPESLHCKNPFSRVRYFFIACFFEVKKALYAGQWWLEKVIMLGNLSLPMEKRAVMDSSAYYVAFGCKERKWIIGAWVIIAELFDLCISDSWALREKVAFQRGEACSLDSFTCLFPIFVHDWQRLYGPSPPSQTLKGGGARNSWSRGI